MTDKRDNTENNIMKSTIFWEIVLIKNYNCTSNGSYEKEEDCPICIESMKDMYVFSLPCGHTFHRECIVDNILTYHRYECPFPKCEKGKLVYVGKD